MSNYANYLPSSSINAFRRCSPTKHVWHVPRTRLSLEANIGTCLRLQCANGTIDGVVFELLKRFYPQREITVTSFDPPYVTLAIKTQEPFNVSGTNWWSIITCSSTNLPSGCATSTQGRTPTTISDYRNDVLGCHPGRMDGKVAADREHISLIQCSRKRV